MIIKDEVWMKDDNAFAKNLWFSCQVILSGASGWASHVSNDYEPVREPDW